LWAAAFIGLLGSPADRFVQVAPASSVTHTAPPPSPPPNATMTLSLLPGLTTIELADMGGIGGVTSDQVSPPLTDFITFEGCEPMASATPTQITEASAGSISMSKTCWLSPMPRSRRTQSMPSLDESHTPSIVPMSASPLGRNSAS
jgi:hypothetical protein